MEEGDVTEIGRVPHRSLRGIAAPAVYATVRARVTAHFLRRLKERGGDPEGLAREGDRLEASGWLRAIRDGDFSLVVPGYGQFRLRVDRYGGGFVAVTFLPLCAG